MEIRATVLRLFKAALSDFRRFRSNFRIGGEMDLTYDQYLNLDTLLNLQQPISLDKECDETLFIVTHQVHELWFKQIALEIGCIKRFLKDRKLSFVFCKLDRMLIIIIALEHQLLILNTITKNGFRKFRKLLGAASGIQSKQYQSIIHHLRNDNDFTARDSSSISLWHLLIEYLVELANRSVDFSCDNNILSSADIAYLLSLSRSEEEIFKLFKILIDIDNNLMKWKKIHLDLVRRLIEDDFGTGGTVGARYLEKSANEYIFPELRQLVPVETIC